MRPGPRVDSKNLWYRPLRQPKRAMTRSDVEPFALNSTAIFLTVYATLTVSMSEMAVLRR
jgi:hypothetical protein